jgi:hypothetical protein
MKLFLSICFFITATIFGYSQQNTGTAKNDNFKWEIAAAYNSVEAQIGQNVIDGWGAYPYSNLYYVGDKTNKSVSFSIIPKRVIKEDLLVRCEFGFTNIYLISHLNGVNDSGAASTQGLIKNDTLKQKIYRFVPGIQWNFLQKKSFCLYGGMSLNYSYYTKSYWKDNLKSSNPNIPDYDRWEGVTPGGFAIGIGTFIGFDIRLTKRFSVGSSFSTALTYYKIGGSQTGMHYAGPNLSTYPRAWSIENNVSSGIQFLKVMPSIQVAIKI